MIIIIIIININMMIILIYTKQESKQEEKQEQKNKYRKKNINLLLQAEKVTIRNNSKNNSKNNNDNTNYYLLLLEKATRKNNNNHNDKISQQKGKISDRLKKKVQSQDMIKNREESSIMSKVLHLVRLPRRPRIVARRMENVRCVLNQHTIVLQLMSRLLESWFTSLLMKLDVSHPSSPSSESVNIHHSHVKQCFSLWLPYSLDRQISN